MILKRSSEEKITFDLSQIEKDAINKGLQSVSEGRYKFHDDVKAESKKKYPNLFK